jgi:hypothetical protein
MPFSAYWPPLIRWWIGTLVLLASSCRQPNNPSPTRYPHEATLTDTTVVHAVRRFVAAHHVNPRETVVYLTLKRRPFGEGGLFYLTYSYNPVMAARLPSQFCTVDSTVVLVYGGSESYLTQPGLDDELARYLTAHRVQFAEGYTLEHPAVWQVQACDGRVLTTSPEPRDYDTVPCGYVLRAVASGWGIVPVAGQSVGK